MAQFWLHVDLYELNLMEKEKAAKQLTTIQEDIKVDAFRQVIFVGYRTFYSNFL